MNPHGTCDDCVWSTVQCEPDHGADWMVWRCWKDCGEPIRRLTTIRDICPPACECHLKEKSDAHL
jgi:hypothetical protein